VNSISSLKFTKALVAGKKIDAYIEAIIVMVRMIAETLISPYIGRENQ